MAGGRSTGRSSTQKRRSSPTKVVRKPQPRKRGKKLAVGSVVSSNNKTNSTKKGNGSVQKTKKRMHKSIRQLWQASQKKIHIVKQCSLCESTDFTVQTCPTCALCFECFNDPAVKELLSNTDVPRERCFICMEEDLMNLDWTGFASLYKVYSELLNKNSSKNVKKSGDDTTKLDKDSSTRSSFSRRRSSAAKLLHTKAEEERKEDSVEEGDHDDWIRKIDERRLRQIKRKQRKRARNASKLFMEPLDFDEELPQTPEDDKPKTLELNTLNLSQDELERLYDQYPLPDMPPDITTTPGMKWRNPVIPSAIEAYSTEEEEVVESPEENKPGTPSELHTFREDSVFAGSIADSLGARALEEDDDDDEEEAVQVTSPVGKLKGDKGRAGGLIDPRKRISRKVVLNEIVQLYVTIYQRQATLSLPGAMVRVEQLSLYSLLERKIKKNFPSKGMADVHLRGILSTVQRSTVGGAAKTSTRMFTLARCLGIRERFKYHPHAVEILSAFLTNTFQTADHLRLCLMQGPERSFVDSRKVVEAVHDLQFGNFYWQIGFAVTACEESGVDLPWQAPDHTSHETVVKAVQALAKSAQGKSVSRFDSSASMVIDFDEAFRVLLDLWESELQRILVSLEKVDQCRRDAINESVRERKKLQRNARDRPLGDKEREVLQRLSQHRFGILSSQGSKAMFDEQLRVPHRPSDPSFLPYWNTVIQHHGMVNRSPRSLSRQWVRVKKAQDKDERQEWDFRQWEWNPDWEWGGLSVIKPVTTSHPGRLSRKQPQSESELEVFLAPVSSSKRFSRRNLIAACDSPLLARTQSTRNGGSSGRRIAQHSRTVGTVVVAFKTTERLVVQGTQGDSEESSDAAEFRNINGPSVKKANSVRSQKGKRGASEKSSNTTVFQRRNASEQRTSSEKSKRSSHACQKRIENHTETTWEAKSSSSVYETGKVQVSIRNALGEPMRRSTSGMVNPKQLAKSLLPQQQNNAAVLSPSVLESKFEVEVTDLALQRRKPLKSLKRGVRQIFRDLHTNTITRTQQGVVVDLRGKGMSRNVLEIEEFVKHLKTNTLPLSTLCLSENGIPDALLSKILYSLNPRHQMRILDISGNHVGSKAVQAISRQLLGQVDVKATGSEGRKPELMSSKRKLTRGNSSRKNLLKLTRSNTEKDLRKGQKGLASPSGKRSPKGSPKHKLSLASFNMGGSMLSISDPAGELHCQNKYTDEGVEELVAKLGKRKEALSHLTRLSMQNVKLEDRLANDLIYTMVVMPDLHHLDLSRNHLGASPASSVVFEKLLARKRQKLAILDLSWNYFNRVTGAALLNSLASNHRSVVKLNFSFNHIGDDGGMVLCKVITENKTLRWVDVGYNQIAADSVAKTMMESLSGNDSLEYLRLTGNGIVDDKRKQALFIEDDRVVCVDPVEEYEEE